MAEKEDLTFTVESCIEKLIGAKVSLNHMLTKEAYLKMQTLLSKNENLNFQM